MEERLYTVSKEAMDLASNIHPAWNKLSFGAKKLHTRNCFQCLGLDLSTPSRFLICWTEKGNKIGGTRTAIVLAEKYNIPVFNLYSERGLDKLLEKCLQL